MENEPFGDYVLQELLGRGGMGEVFRAYDTKRKRTVALKRLPAVLARDDTFRRRFRTESEVAARLNDPHVLPIHNFGEIDGRLFIDMRLVAGSDLAALLSRRGPLEPAVAVDVLAQVASALDAAHRDELVHRDVKPSNVLLVLDEADSEIGFAYLTDFGVAQVGGEDTSLSTTNAVAGTLDYIAPERFTSRRAGHRADIYSLGCVLYEMLTGDRPFPVQSLPEALHAHIYLPPPKPSDAVPGVPAGLDAVVARAMAKSPDDRYPTCAAMAADARAALAGRQVEDGVGPAVLPEALIPTADPAPADVRAAAAPSTLPPASGAEPEDARGIEQDAAGPGLGATPAAAASTGDAAPAPKPAVSPDAPTARPPMAPAAPPQPPAPVSPARPRRRPLATAAAALGAAAAITAAVVVVDYVASPGESRADTVTAEVAPAPASVPAAPVAAPIPAVDGVFAGRTSNNEITVAVATRNGQVAAYICDGESVEAWLDGDIQNREVRLRNAKGAVLSGTVTDEAAFGTMTVGGRTLPFSAQLAPAPAGLYEARSENTRTGWIVLADGSQVGLSQTNGVSTPAPALDPATGTAQGPNGPIQAVALTGAE
ncbi:serine/threonine-protein kinase [Actinomycetospora lemnae]|uniref:non-specific serine/threonine protein kinase n=1 Tax=Actinomycetospora lemnae TaxID=3019891 RepID=A0ABT5SXD8_9PSEU|nr:serine/threonine-protein kinase [Actinomycetospora sp. DW7H6]MDD7966811.1 serine/threonine-protein kinase [Actinomycetospora sp. DW7H6]